jgi:hypothetical protein
VAVGVGLLGETPRIGVAGAVAAGLAVLVTSIALACLAYTAPHPQASQPEVPHPQAPRPEVPHPQASRPEVPHPGVPRPEVRRPEPARGTGGQRTRRPASVAALGPSGSDRPRLY